jgi:hypothetical protein
MRAAGGGSQAVLASDHGFRFMLSTMRNCFQKLAFLMFAWRRVFNMRMRVTYGNKD